MTNVLVRLWHASGRLTRAVAVAAAGAILLGAPARPAVAQSPEPAVTAPAAAPVAAIAAAQEAAPAEAGQAEHRPGG
ncbi:MAG TPA: hypothetical protein VFV33_12615, partial [Gemmatimonadaceae bacterium]|nr:hypothetical protein [Gemmatimonadaceae bacterium]